MCISATDARILDGETGAVIEGHRGAVFGATAVDPPTDFHHSGTLGLQAVTWQLAGVPVTTRSTIRPPASHSGRRCTVFCAGYQLSPAGSPAMFQLHDTVGVMGTKMPGPTMPTRSTGSPASP